MVRHGVPRPGIRLRRLAVPLWLLAVALRLLLVALGLAAVDGLAVLRGRRRLLGLLLFPVARLLASRLRLTRLTLTRLTLTRLTLTRLGRLTRLT